MSATSVGSSPGNPRTRRRRWLLGFSGSSLTIAILLHVLFGVGAAYWIVEHFQKKHVNFHAAALSAPNTEVEHKIEMTKKNNVDSAPPDLKRIVTTEVSDVILPDVPEVPQTDEIIPTAMSGVSGQMGNGMGSGHGGGTGGGGGDMDTPPPAFGAPNGKGLKGYLYDLKQTSDKQATGMDVPTFLSYLTQYLNNRWDETMLDKYYKVKDPLYSSCIAITTRPSEEAPRAFHVENEVQPAFWVVHYHGKVMAPASGDYQFFGFADDILVVSIDNVVVLDAGWAPLFNDPKLQGKLPFAFPSYLQFGANGDPHLRSGSTFHLEKGQVVNMDVLIGDCGGVCSYFLLVKKIGATYEKASDGTEKIPFFELNSTEPPSLSSGEHPPYSTTPEPWQAPSEAAIDNPFDLGN